MQVSGKTAYVPYRESKLTSLLKESIGGNSYSLMISGLSPSDKFIEENISTLNYSTKANCISNTPIKNQDPNIKIIAQLKVLPLNLQNEIRELTRDLKKANDHIELLTKLVESNSELNKGLNVSKGEAVKQIFNEEVLKLELPVEKLTEGIPVAKKNELIMDRLLENVNMVKEVLQSNLKLREQVQELNKKIEMMNAEIFYLQSDREEQKDRLEILSKMQNSLMLTKKLSAEDKIRFQQRMIITDEMLQLKKEKQMLEQRISYLEMENAYIRNNAYPTNRKQPGTDDFEPVRSFLNDSSILAPLKRNITGLHAKRPLRLVYEQDISPKIANIRTVENKSSCEGLKRGASAANRPSDPIKNRNTSYEKGKSKRCILPNTIERIEDISVERDGSRVGNRLSWKKNTGNKFIHSNHT